MKLARIFKMLDEGLESRVIAERIGFTPSHINLIKNKRIEIINSLNHEERQSLDSLLPSRYSSG